MFSLDHYQKIDSYLPINLSTASGFAMAFLVIYGFIVIRYIVAVAPFYFYFWPQRNLKSGYLHNGAFAKNQISTEIKYSFISSLIFAFAGVLIGWLWQNEWTLIYIDLKALGLIYLPISFLLLSLSHEVYFYFTHRWMHHKKIFKHIHYIHHLSKNTSPWASFSFHPFEAIVLAAYLPLAVLVIPLHPLVIIFYMVFMTLTAISNHLGVEIIRQPKLLKYFISGTHHAAHHQNYNVNFGLYYCFIDRLCKTEDLKRIK